MLNDLIIKTMPLIPKLLVKKVASKYIAGPQLSDAVRVTQELMSENGMSTIDVLGEFVDTKERALHEKEMSSLVIDAVHNNNLHSYLSVKPTSLGLGIDVDFAYDNISFLVKKSNVLNLVVCLDMENSPYTTKTIDLYKKLRENGFDNLGVVFQSYMRRSEDDIKSLLEYKPPIRLCKGIYKEIPEIAFQEKNEVRDNYKKLLRLIFDNGMYIGIATHDEELLQDALQYISQNNISKDKYEFQMLLGVREKRRNELLEQGHKLRVYVPFGEDWYGYATRRLKENPDMASHIVKAMFFKG
ncbi:proline dehydrogenase family protein [Bacteroidota bacterium]